MRRFFKTLIIFILTLEARLVLRKYRPKIIAVTGSVGKTSTKDALFAVLAAHDFVRKSEKSFNSDIGIPLTILGLPNGWYDWHIWLENIVRGTKLLFSRQEYPHKLVLEVGADRPGDIRRVARWLKPDIVVVTHIGEVPVHVEFFDSPDALLEEKGSIVRAQKKGGVLILSADDPRARSLGKQANHARVMTYGFSESARIRASDAVIRYADKGGRRFPDGLSFQVTTPGMTTAMELSGVLGRQGALAALAAVALGIAEGMSMVAIKKSLKDITWPPGRLSPLEGKNGSLLLDDSYNASPSAVHAALETLGRIERGGGRKIAVLGDMLELGKYTSDAHKRAGEEAAAVADMVIGVGMRAERIIDGAHAAGMPKKETRHFKTSEEAGIFLAGEVRTGDVILLKGSQKIRMERAVKMILSHPEDAEKLLVRQEPVWRGK